MRAQIYKRADGRWTVHFPEPSKADLDPDGTLEAMDPDGSGFATSGEARRGAKKVVAAMHRFTGAFHAEVVDHDPTGDDA